MLATARIRGEELERRARAIQVPSGCGDSDIIALMLVNME